MLHGTSLLRIIFKAINLSTFKSDGFFQVTRASTLLFLFRYMKRMTQVLMPGKRVQVRKKLPDQFCNSPYCQPYNSYNVSSENLVLDQLIIPKLIFFFILITYLVDIVLILYGEILSWSLMGVKGSK